MFLAVQFYHIVQVRTRGQAGASNKRNDITTLDPLPFLHQGLRKVSIESFNSESMIYADYVSKLRIVSYGRNPSLGRGMNLMSNT